MTLYENELKRLLDYVKNYNDFRSSEEELISFIVNTENQITNIEENNLRDFIQNIENEIESAKFMFSDKEYKKELGKILNKFEKEINYYIKNE